MKRSLRLHTHKKTIVMTLNVDTIRDMALDSRAENDWPMLESNEELERVLLAYDTITGQRKSTCEMQKAQSAEVYRNWLIKSASVVPKLFVARYFRRTSSCFPVKKTGKWTVFNIRKDGVEILGTRVNGVFVPTHLINGAITAPLLGTDCFAHDTDGFRDDSMSGFSDLEALLASPRDE